jgi:hypothetical protein
MDPGLYKEGAPLSHCLQKDIEYSALGECRATLHFQVPSAENLSAN